MPHVSRHMPTGDVWEKIYKELLTHLTEKGSAFERAQLGAELFTPTERIMLAKRLAIICMVGEGYTFEDIQESLRVSPSTVARIWAAMQKGKYAKIVNIVRKRNITQFFRSLFPRGVTEPRWTFFK
jgi:uncharacterized protein YerC